jgi:hypothetical protein
MSSYPASIRRCHHIKVNGTQCGSPALRDEKHCHFHSLWLQKQLDVNKYVGDRLAITLPTLEDANSIQVGLAEVMRLLIHNLIDHRTAALLLHALRTASINLKHTSFEPEQPTHVVIDRDCVERRPLGTTAWSVVEGCEYDDAVEPFNPSRRYKDDVPAEKFDGDASFDSMLTSLIDRAALTTGNRYGRRGKT